MKKYFLLFLVSLLLFSCATGKQLERVETTVEKIEEIEETKESDSEIVSFDPIKEIESIEEDLSSLPVLFADGEFFDIKNEGEKGYEKNNESRAVTKVEETKEIEKTPLEAEPMKNIVAYCLFSAFIVLALVILFLVLGTRKKKKEKVAEDTPIWEEKEEYSSLLEILSLEKAEEKE